MKADVAVVGGGPAGAASAILLARRGFDVALFDRARFPRDKPCGEFVNGAACRMLGALGVNLDEYAAISAAKWVTQNSIVDITLRETGHSVRRTVLDSLLLTQAEIEGVRVFEGHNVRSLDGTKVTGEGFSCEAKLVIAADGTHSRIARNLNLVRPIPRLQRIGVTAHIHLNHPIDQGKVVLFSRQSGDAAVGGFCMQSERHAVLSLVLPKLQGRIDRFFIQDFVKRRFFVEAEVEEIKTTACFGHRLKRPYADGVLFVGDAARFVDPFTGEGIHHALDGARVAAAVSEEALRSGRTDERKLSRYGSLRRGLELRYLASDIVQAVIHQPLFAERVAHHFVKHPDAAERLFAILTDSLPPKAVFA